MRTRSNTGSIRSEHTTIVVAITISNPPHSSRGVIVWLRVSMLRATAVTGSSAPKIAVEVEPMQCIATVVQPSDTTVGNAAKAARFTQYLRIPKI